MEKGKPIPIEKLPYDQFKLLGMDKKDVLALPEWTMDALLSGNRTSLIQFDNIKPNGISEAVTINAKLSLQKDGEKYNLKMHPVALQPKNDLELSLKEIEFLKKDPLNVLPKKVLDRDGKSVDSFVTLDKATNDFVAVKRDKLQPPEAINDIYLSEAQKKDFVNGKPIQLGKEEYRMDVNSEQGVSGKNLEKIKFKSAEYNAYNFLVDAALIVSGLGVLVLVEHLAKLAFHNRVEVHDLLKQDLRPAIKRTIANIKEKSENGIQLTNKEKNEMLVFNVKDTVGNKLENKTEVSQAQGSEISKQLAQATVNQPNFTYSGKLLEHGPAPYEFNKENKDNYFVRLATDAGERLVWGIDFGRAIQESNAKIGEQVGINHEGFKQVKVNVDVRNNKGKVTGTEEKVIDRNNWNIQVLGNDITQEQKHKNIIETKPNLVINPSVETGLEKRNNSNTLFIKFDATKDIKGEKMAINAQLKDQLKNYNGNGRIVVLNGITTQKFELPEQKTERTEQSSKVEELKKHINQEIRRITNAKSISASDEIKIVHPEQRQSTETKKTLVNDNNKQLNNAANAKNEIKADKKEMNIIKRGRGR